MEGRHLGAHVRTWKRDGSGSMCSLAAVGLTDEKKSRKATKKVCFKKSLQPKVNRILRKGDFGKNILMAVANRPKPIAYLQGCYEGENKKKVDL